MAGSVITIGLLLPDVLGTYSDTGNAVVLAQRLHRGYLKAGPDRANRRSGRARARPSSPPTPDRS